MSQGMGEFILYTIIIGVMLFITGVIAGGVGVLVVGVLIYFGIPIIAGLSSFSPRIKIHDFSLENDTNNNVYNTYRIWCIIISAVVAVWIIIALGLDIQEGKIKVPQKSILPGTMGSIVVGGAAVYLLSILIPHAIFAAFRGDLVY